jgi:N-methylhydantoinase A
MAYNNAESTADITSQGRKYRLGVDIGGTFTDIVLVDEFDGSIKVVKVSTVPDDPSIGFLDGVTAAFEKFGIAAADIEFVVHGTTIATNTIIQGKGAKTGLMTTAGFSDVLEIAYQTRPTLYDLFYEKPKPLVDRYMTAGVRERIGADGQVIVPLDEADVEAAARRLIADGAEAITIAFLHSYRDPAHERRAAEIVSSISPDLTVVLSSNVCPEYREYPRTSTAVVNAVLAPRVAPYLSRLEVRLRDEGVVSDLHLMTSSGGIITSGVAKRLPVHLVESGPAAGVIGAAFVAGTLKDKELGRKILALDIGGTTAKVSLVDDGMPALAEEFEVGTIALPSSTSSKGLGYPVKMPVINLVEIGAGGGSIAFVDSGGALAVGPDSAGAAPGPACYGKGGQHPTITDANLVLGRINPDYFLGGAITAYPELSRIAIERFLAGPLGLDVEAAARAVIDIANAKMVAALQLISVKRGIDPREYAIVPSGGAGPMHAAAIARELGSKTVIIPPTPGLNSAVGLLATDIKHEVVRSVFCPTDDIDPDEFRSIVDEMEKQGRGVVREQGMPDDRIQTIVEAEICYSGQNYPLRVLIGVEGVAAANAEFRRQHHRRYGFASESEPTVILNLRLTAIGRIDRPRIKPVGIGSADTSSARKAVRRVVFEQAVDCLIYDRDKLLVGNVIKGPAIIEQMDTTIVAPAYTTTRVDIAGSLVMSLDEFSTGGVNA